MSDPTREHPAVATASRLGAWAHREPLSAVAVVLIVMHLVVVGFYVTGQAVSAVPFTDATAETVINLPVVWLCHLVAAVLLAGALTHPRWREHVGGFSVFVWLAYAVALGMAARFRHPPLPLLGAAFAAGLALLAAVLAVLWRGRDESP